MKTVEEYQDILIHVCAGLDSTWARRRSRKVCRLIFPLLDAWDDYIDLAGTADRVLKYGDKKERGKAARQFRNAERKLDKLLGGGKA